MDWRRNCSFLPFCSWNWNWRPSFQLSLVLLASRRSKHWSCPNWPSLWLLDSLPIHCWRNQLPRPLQKPRLPLRPHRTSQAGMVRTAVAHMPVFGIHRLHRTLLTALIIQEAPHQAASAAAAAVAPHRPAHHRRPNTPPSRFTPNIWLLLT